MKTTASITLALAASVLAAPQQWDPLPNKRDVQTISTVITQVSAALSQLDTSVKAFNGQDFTQLASDAANVKSALDSGTQQITATTPITAQDAITLQSSLSPVQSTAASLVTDLNAKKPQIQQASLCQIVQQQTQGISTSANALINATVSKIPANLQAVAGQLTGQFTSQLSDTSLNFATGNCTNAAGGAGAGLAFSNSSTTASSTTAGTAAKSAASTQVASAFGLILVGAASFLML
ncbi:hypothetical protein N0V93_000849 [Gnomoniopsis smithogilvyi]|uniref:Cell wall protein n=1 Tax=Gnomoniopsis smithogilvyi TaxID=1191159 RepID=A0A9W8Z2K4_9PEZI|nr:hypothetical protein N0V93_000849 [Gnomoniopsis smithogilvyi]